MLLALLSFVSGPIAPVGAEFLVTPAARKLSFKAARMPFVGDVQPAVNPGETVPLAINLGPWLPLGDTLVSAETAMQVYPPGGGEDSNAAALLIGSPYLSGVWNGVAGVWISQFAGGPNPGGFQAGVTYTFVATFATALGVVETAYIRIPCEAVS